MNKIKEYIEPYLLDLQKIFVYKVGPVECGFILDIELFFRIIENNLVQY